ncbi:metal-dependent phosphohydrolase [Halomonas sp. MCCC 1A17488]|uniref:PilZ domain-containing protein n=1 Tax=unclassified Halomonas TaxID=2609666 RepID=UPI0018D22F2B|nr:MULTISPECIES: HD domain-containing phosphohydrolase [unclassified Halomonas]MCE8014816.1 metal-dependent phosphohydrolase [Halomonas sp. MCCC 1A17488]MCG3238149.1 metal-dependent phosphohydrolase [Halomonas sp. MCCC 1A17488]QPP48083.1 PilZ domain-containing protein [Halomonas sp. SS10-MC5]
MNAAPRSGNPSAQVIRSLLQHKHQLSMHSKNAPYALPAQVTELDLEAGQLVLEAEYSGSDIEQYTSGGGMSFDIEALKAPDAGEREVYSISNVSAKILKTDSTTYRLECQLPESVFVQDSRGAIRIPFILGMQARVSVEVYLHELSIPGRLRNLSVGGCMVDIDIADSIAITVGQSVPGITLEFPSGVSFFAEASIRHMRPFGNHGHAAVGFQFINLTTPQSEALFHYVSEAEREAAYRTGANDAVATHSPLFIPGAKEKKILQREEQERQKHAQRSPVQRGVMEIAHQIQIGLMYMKTRHLFPEEILYDCADTLLYLVAQDRKALLYALAFLRNEPDWVRHAVQVAGQLADMMLLRDPHSPHVREAVLGALLHSMGKPLLVSEELPSLKVHMKPYQKEILKGHVAALKEKLQALGWSPSPTCRDVLVNANERLDGSGYPAGKRGEQLSELARLVSVLKAINKLTHERNGIPPRAPLDAYRWVNDASGAYDKTILVEYIQQYGLYPIGSLAKFSGSFLAWIMDIDAKGMPTKVNVIKNLSFKDTNIDSVLTSKDFAQIGKLEGVVNPADYGVRIAK